MACLGLMTVVHAGDDSKAVPVADYQAPIRLACIGDSITHGSYAGRPVCYATVVANALGKQWEVSNFGVSGATLLNTAAKPYTKLPQYAQALALKPDVATIALGTNDSKPSNWEKKAGFEADYKDLIAALRQANPKVIIYCCLPPPLGTNKFGIDPANLKDEVIPLIRKVASDTGCHVINLYESLDGKPECFSDHVHPNADGHKFLAATVYKALTGLAIPAASPVAAP
jgi:acyl-CoA thioesterase-1